jgi:hypothetical protein
MPTAQAHCGFCGALHRRGGQQQGQTVVQLGLGFDAARRVELRQQWMDAGLLQRPDGAGWNVAY